MPTGESYYMYSPCEGLVLLISNDQCVLATGTYDKDKGNCIVQVVNSHIALDVIFEEKKVFVSNTICKRRSDYIIDWVEKHIGKTAQYFIMEVG